jgi:hypothetical protein
MLQALQNKQKMRMNVHSVDTIQENDGLKAKVCKDMCVILRPRPQLWAMWTLCNRSVAETKTPFGRLAAHMSVSFPFGGDEPTK